MMDLWWHRKFMSKLNRQLTTRRQHQNEEKIFSISNLWKITSEPSIIVLESVSGLADESLRLASIFSILQPRVEVNSSKFSLLKYVSAVSILFNDLFRRKVGKIYGTGSEVFRRVRSLDFEFCLEFLWTIVAGEELWHQMRIKLHKRLSIRQDCVILSGKQSWTFGWFKILKISQRKLFLFII